MKIEDFDCVKMKRRAQELVDADTQGMTTDELLAYYHRIGEAMRQEQDELRKKAELRVL